MSWECNCEGARERSREHRPGSHIVCPFCGRTREHVALLEEARYLLSAAEAGEPITDLDGLARLVAAYWGGGGPEEVEEAEPQLPLRDVPTVAVEVIEADGSPEEQLEAGHRLWRHKVSGRSFSIVAEDERKVVLRELGATGPEALHNTYVSRDCVVSEYEPIWEK